MKVKPDFFPSQSIQRTGPGGWIQWKGTDVCCDIHCECGAFWHFDGGFMYHVKCSECGQVYECDGHITLHKVDAEPENVKLLIDEYWEQIEKAEGYETTEWNKHRK